MGLLVNFFYLVLLIGYVGWKTLSVLLHFVDLESADDLIQKRITRILTTDIPQYFAVVARVRQETSTIGPDGGMISSTVVPRVQAIFPEGSLTKNIKVGLQVSVRKYHDESLEATVSVPAFFNLSS